MFGTLSGTMAREIHEIIVRHLISWYEESQHTAIEHGLKIIPVLPVIYQVFPILYDYIRSLRCIFIHLH